MIKSIEGDGWVEEKTETMGTDMRVEMNCNSGQCNRSCMLSILGDNQTPQKESGSSHQQRQYPKKNTKKNNSPL